MKSFKFTSPCVWRVVARAQNEFWSNGCSKILLWLEKANCSFLVLYYITADIRYGEELFDHAVHFPENTGLFPSVYFKVFCSPEHFWISFLIGKKKERERFKLDQRFKSGKCSLVTQSCGYIFLSPFQQCLAKLPLISRLLLDKTFICLFTTPTATGITLNKLQLNMTFNVKLSTANAIAIVSGTTCSLTSFSDVCVPHIPLSILILHYGLRHFTWLMLNIFIPPFSPKLGFLLLPHQLLLPLQCLQK